MITNRKSFLCLLALVLGFLLVSGCSSETTGPNRPPVAVAGPDRMAPVGEKVVLNGSESFDPEGRELSYHWELVAAPPEGKASLIEDTAETTQLVPDIPGVWVIRLAVSDGSLTSEPDVAQVRAIGKPCEQDPDCDDGLWCNGDEYCSNGFCRFSSRDCSSVADPCNQAGCDEDADDCVGVPVADGTGCDDGLYCTVDDVCSGGDCGGQTRDCSDAGAECVAGVCNEAGSMCVGEPIADGDLCDDGQYCTVNERCNGGQCEGGQPRDCTAAGGGCVDGVCDETANQCAGDPLAQGTLCNDDLFCTIDDSCDGLGNCTGTARDCSGLSNQCNQGSCDDTADQCMALPFNEGNVCDDGVYCNVDETCQSGSCTGGRARDCSVVADACNHGYCDEGAGQCQKQPSNDGQPCNDQQFCTNPDTCSGGTCSGPQRDCGGFGDQCNDGICDEANDTCTQQPKSGGTSCNDGIYCNGTDQCDGSGSCGVHAGDPCVSGAPCNRTCNESSDDCFAPPGTACGSPATTDCTDADTCDGAGTCQPNHKGSGTSCDDDIYCNGADQCDGSGNCAVHAGDPCPGQVCDETGTQCVDCLADTDCLPCQWCQGTACENQPDGTDVKGDCASGACRTGLCDGTGSCGYSPSETSCGSSQDSACDHADQCDGAGTCDPNYEPADTPCSDGQYCNGLETCNGSGICQTGSDPCSGTNCNENTDQCAECVADDQCGFCMWCESGTGTCANQPDGTDVKSECSPGDCLTGLCDGNGNCGTDPDGTPCNGGDGNWCNSSCNGSGNCTGNSVICPDDGNLCNGSESCNSSNGSCQSGPNLPASTYCDGNDLITCDGNGNPTGSETCQLGCNAGADPDRCAQVNPSNIDPARMCANGDDLNIASATTINTDDGSITPDPGVGASIVVSPGGGAPDIRVFSFNNIDIQADVNVVGNNALALLACHDITIDGVIYARSTDRNGGPGGWDGGTGESNGSGFDNGYGKLGPGDSGSPWEQAGGGGAGFGGVGGDGGDAAGDQQGGAGGQSYPGPTLEPLLGGSGGGGGGCWDNDDGGPGGGGGGAVQITAGGTLTVLGGAGVHAGGGGGNRSVGDGCAGGGGGAGGGILLEAVVVDMDGTLAANGGGGGGGDQWGSGVNSGNGEDGRFDGTRASGGNGGGDGGRGGDGGAAGTANGDFGTNANKAGGGGGAVGRIRINTQSGSASIGGATSPDAGSGMFTQGTVSIQ